VSAIPIESVRDECYRCGYDLRGIANDGACPECGLLAERSRRVTNELHDTRPRWLRSLSRGIDLILLAIFAPIGESFVAAIILRFCSPSWNPYPDFTGFDLSAVLLGLGVILLTRPEGYPPADRADRRLRILMRIVVIIPVAAMVLLQLQLHLLISSGGKLFLFGEQGLVVLLVLFFAIFAFLPLLLFLRLRGLARRVRSAHLAEHCIIVGVGAFVSMLYIAAVIIVANNADKWGFRSNWMSRSPVSLIMMLAMSVASGLFILWSLYLLVRFAIAFWIAAGKLRGKWTRDDRSLQT
jgi:hypothetical protein